MNIAVVKTKGRIGVQNETIIFRSIAILLVVLFPFSAFSMPMVVVPIHDGIKDDLSDNMADSLANVLRENNFDVVARDKVEAVLKYHHDTTNKTTNNAPAAIAMAREHYYNFDYAEAMAQITSAINILEGEPNKISEHGLLLRDAYVTAGIIEKTENGNSARAYLKKALQIDPHYEPDAKTFSPSLVRLFTEVRTEVSRKPEGAIRIETDPKVAEVCINGIAKGVTPIIISNLPVGNYTINIKTNKYKPVERQVFVSADKMTKIREKLYWNTTRTDQSRAIYNLLSSSDEAREQIEDGLRIAELLRVPKVVMVDADETASGRGEIAVRMIDRKYRAGHNPIIIRYSREKENLAEGLSEATAVLIKQTEAAIADNPARYLDPDGIGDPVLLSKRKKELLAIPAFWAVVGGALAASAGGVTAAVMSGGPSSTTGSVNVQFK